ncbi:MAG TPA: chaperone modulator CbpM [Gammaproteobacteria bacterium]
MSDADPITGDVLDERVELSLADLCRMCGLREEAVIEMVEEGIIEPRGPDRSGWRFSGVAVTRVRRAVRLQRDFEVNLPGAALALDLLEEIERLRRRLP